MLQKDILSKHLRHVIIQENHQINNYKIHIKIKKISRIHLEKTKYQKLSKNFNHNYK